MGESIKTSVGDPECQVLKMTVQMSQIYHRLQLSQKEKSYQTYGVPKQTFQTPIKQIVSSSAEHRKQVIATVISNSDRV